MIAAIQYLYDAAEYARDVATWLLIGAVLGPPFGVVAARSVRQVRRDRP